MRIDRAEMAGTGVALVFHVAMIAALSLSLARVVRVPETPPREFELVEDVGAAPSAPSQVATPPPAEQAPEIGPPPPTPMPIPAPTPAAPRIAPSPAPRSAQPAAARPAPPAARPAAPRASRLGADFLKGIAAASASTAPAKPSAKCGT